MKSFNGKSSWGQYAANSYYLGRAGFVFKTEVETKYIALLNVVRNKLYMKGHDNFDKLEVVLTAAEVVYEAFLKEREGKARMGDPCVKFVRLNMGKGAYKFVDLETFELVDHMEPLLWNAQEVGAYLKELNEKDTARLRRQSVKREFKDRIEKIAKEIDPEQAAKIDFDAETDKITEGLGLKEIADKRRRHAEWIALRLISEQKGLATVYRNR